MKSQRGSAHAVIIIVLVLVLITALGWIFWQNFIYKEPVVKRPVVNSGSSEPATDKESTTNEKVFRSKIGYTLTVPRDVSITESKDAKSADSFYLAGDKDTQRGLTIYWRTADEQTEGTPEGYKGIDISGRELEVVVFAKLPAVRVTDNPKLLEDYWIYNEAKDKVVRATFTADSDTKLAKYRDILKTIEWL